MFIVDKNKMKKERNKYVHEKREREKGKVGGSSEGVWSARVAGSKGCISCYHAVTFTAMHTWWLQHHMIRQRRVTFALQFTLSLLTYNKWIIHVGYDWSVFLDVYTFSSLSKLLHFNIFKSNKFIQIDYISPFSGSVLFSIKNVFELGYV